MDGNISDMLRNLKVAATNPICDHDTASREGGIGVRIIGILFYSTFSFLSESSVMEVKGGLARKTAGSPFLAL
jgi:hypothetical protein